VYNGKFKTLRTLLLENVLSRSPLSDPTTFRMSSGSFRTFCTAAVSQTLIVYHYHFTLAARCIKNT